MTSTDSHQDWTTNNDCGYAWAWQETGARHGTMSKWPGSRRSHKVQPTNQQVKQPTVSALDDAPVNLAHLDTSS